MLQSGCGKAVVATGGLFLLLAAGSHGAQVLQTYFAPFPENSMQMSLEAINNYGGAVGNEIRTVISIVPSMDETVLYYDHWEDGYEQDITSPTQATTEIWGDNNTTNGIPPGFTNDVVNAGDIVNLEDTIDVTRNEVTIEYDGGDKIGVTRPVAMTRAIYAIVPGEVLAEACGVFDVGSHGLEYRAPVGSGTGVGTYTNQCFEYSAFHIMADYNYTRIDIDKDNDGVFETTEYLDEGETYLVNGGVLAGATVRGSKPFQCYLITGDISSTYEMRWYELWSTDRWDSDYFTPVGGKMDGANYYGTIIYVFNPNTNSITIEYRTLSSTGTFSVAAGSVSDAFAMPTNSGGRFYTTNGSEFAAVQVFDVRAPGVVGECQDYDWGISLIPVSALTTMGIVGWGPGKGTTVGGGLNGSPAWVTAVSNTTLYVDYDTDPMTGPLTDPLGNRYDFSTNLVAYQFALLFDNSDTNQTGIRFYTLNGAFISSAWGEDPDAATPYNPHLDMGCDILPFPTIYARKYATLLIDLNTNGIPDAGDSIKYYVEVVNVGFAIAQGVILEDVGPTNKVYYEPDSSTTNGGAMADDFVPPKQTLFPFDEGGADIGTIPIDGTTMVTYVTTVYDPYPTNEAPCIQNNAIVWDTNGQWNALGFQCIALPGLTLTKTNDPDGLVQAGSNILYTIVVANTGNVTLTDVELDDLLPVGVAYVPGTMKIYVPFATTSSVRDRFDGQFYTNNDGSANWTTDWIEEGESDGPIVGDVGVLPDTGNAPTESFALLVDGPANGAYRTFNASSYTNALLTFKYRRGGTDDGTEYVGVYASSNGGSTWSAALLTLGGAGGADTNYALTNLNLTPYISSNTAVRFYSQAAMEDGDSVWFDEVRIVYVGTPVTNDGGAPPDVFTGYSLPPGQALTVRFRVLVDDPPTATQLINVARTRAEQHQDWLYAEVTNYVDTTVGVTLTKVNNPDGLVTPGTTIVYTITIANTAAVQQTNVELDDILPPGVTYVPGTARVWRPYGHTNTVADYFDAKAYTNNNGNVNWLNSWQEVAEADGAQAGYLQVALDGAPVPGRVYALEIGDNTANATDYGVWRMANLGGYTAATLSFEYRRAGMDAGEDLAVYASSDGGATWSAALLTFLGTGGDDPAYIATNVGITAYISTNTAIRFLNDGDGEDGEYVWIDNVTITYSGNNATNALAPPTDLFSGYHIPPYTSLVVTLSVTVDDPPTATQMINTARTRSDQQVDWLYAYTTNWLVATPGLSLTKASSVNGHYWGIWETGTYTMVIANTGTLTQTGVTLIDYLPTGTVYVAGSTRIMLPVLTTNVTTNVFSGTFRDEFNAVSFANNNGSSNWLNNWQEEGETDGPTNTAGDVTVTNLWGTNYQLKVFDDLRGAWRAAGVPANVTNAVLSFNYRRALMDANEYLLVYASAAYGTNWTQIATLTNLAGASDAATQSTNINITAYVSTGTSIRIWSPTALGPAEGVSFDNIQIAYSGATYTTNVVYGSTTNVGGAVPNLAGGMTIPTGQSVTVTFQVTLDWPTYMTAITNTAYVTSDQSPQLQATVTDVVTWVSVGDFVWNDVDRDGIQDGGSETGIPGVVVNLYDGQTNLVASTVTDTNGYYIFNGWPTNSYFLEFQPPTNWYIAPVDRGGDNAVDSDANTNTGRTVIFDLGVGASNMTWDAGFYLPLSAIGDYVWFDANTNGIQDGGASTGFPGVTVNLYDGDSNLVDTIITTATGYYSFTNLYPGSYFVNFVSPAGYAFTLANQGGNDNVDSDASQSGGNTTIFTLPSGVNVTNWDAGLMIPIPGLTITKTSNSGGDCWDPGDIITYTITVQNTGTFTHTGISVTDPVPTGTTYVSGSTLVAWPSAGFTNTVRDEFDAVAYTNNDGTTNWLGNWTEESDDGDVAAGDVLVFNGLNAYVLRTKDNGNGAYRVADLSGATNAQFSFNWRRFLMDGDDYYDVYVSSNGGVDWVQLIRYTGNTGSDAAFSYTTFNISAYISTNTAIRFFTPDGGMDDNEGMDWDDVQITYSRGVAIFTNAGSAPPTLTSGQTLAPGQQLVVTFQVSNNTPSTVTQVVNTATTAGNNHPAISATVTDCVDVTDLGVIKDPNKSTPYGTNELVWFTVTLTNNGPVDATSVELTDTWPPNVIYYWSSASRGSYNHSQRKWYVGDLNVGETVTLWMTGRVNAAGYVYITNWMEITYLDQYDTNPLNDKDDAAIETLVILTRFELAVVDGKVLVEWETASEVNTVGFYVYRLEPDGVTWVKVSDEILPAMLTAPQGGVYRLHDPGARPGRVYQYRLVEVESNGRENTYGPFLVETRVTGSKQASASKALSKDDKARSAALKRGYLRLPHVLDAEGLARRAMRKETLAKDAVVPGGETRTRVKVQMTEAGVYFVSAADLAAAAGISEAGVRELILNQLVALSRGGAAVRYVPAYDGLGVYFVGMPVDSIYTDQNTYWVAGGSALIMKQVDGRKPLPAPAGQTFRESVHAEEDVWPSVALANDPEGDFWYWAFLVAGSSSSSNASVTVDVPGLALTAAPAELTVNLMGGSSTGLENEHHAVILLNGVEVAQAYWSGKAAHSCTTAIDPSLLIEGVNTVTVQARKDTGASLSVFAVDSVDVAYQRRYEAVNGRLMFRGDQNRTVSVEGFQSPDVYVIDVSNPDQPQWVVRTTTEEQGGLYRVSFRPKAGWRRYMACSGDAFRAPDAVVGARKTSLTGAQPGAGYVVITSEDLRDAAGHVAAHRNAQGLSARVVSLDEIYDVFSYGLPTPRAIKDFLDHAFTYWVQPPGYVLLLGKGTYDYKDIQGYGDNVVPVRLSATDSGLFACDNWFADVVGNDGVPDMAIGRLPVITTQEVDRVLLKMQTHEAGAGAWTRRIMLAADDPDAGGGFSEDSDGLAGFIPGDYTVSKTYLTNMSASVARQRIKDGMNAGMALLNYIGHGGTDRIASEGILRSSDVASLTNSVDQPLVAAFTCVAGRHELPGYDCLAEQLLMRDGGGAVAVWTASGMSLNSPSVILDEEFFKVRFSGAPGLLGDWIREALEQYTDRDGRRLILDIYNCLGDPALQAR